MLENNRDEDVCRKWDDLAEQDHTYRMSEYTEKLEDDNSDPRLLEVPTMEIVIEFFLHQVAMERILVVFLRIQRKSTKEDACKGLRSNGATRCLQIFGENLRRIPNSG